MTSERQQSDRQNRQPEAEGTDEARPSSETDSMKTDSTEWLSPDAASAGSETRPADAMEDMPEEAAAADQEKDELKDRLLRLSAEFDNYKKRIDRQWSDFKKYAHESLIKELLNAVDNLERAVEAAGQDKARDDGLVAGVSIILAEILKTFERFGVKQITAKGEKFDPAYHQAVSTQEAEDTEDNIVLEEFQKGYMIHDRLLRPAMVLVSMKK